MAIDAFGISLNGSDDKAFGISHTDGIIHQYAKEEEKPAVISLAHNPIITTALTDAVALDGYVIDVEDVTGVSAGDLCFIYDIVDGDPVYSLARIVSISTLGVTLDRYLDNSYDSGAVVIFSSKDLNVTGTMASPITFNARVISSSVLSTVFNVCSITLFCTTTTAISMENFGDISDGLANGVQIRKVTTDGYQNIVNFKTNADIMAVGYDFQVIDAANPGQDTYGFCAKITFADRGTNNTVLRLDTDEDLEVVVKDDLSSLGEFTVTVKGYTIDAS